MSDFDILNDMIKAIVSLFVTIVFGHIITRFMANLIEDKEYIHRFLKLLVMLFRDTFIYFFMALIIFYVLFSDIKVLENSSILNFIFAMLYIIALMLTLVLWLFKITTINGSITHHFKMIEVNNTKYQLHSLKDNKVLVSSKEEINEDYQNFKGSSKDIKKYTVVNKKYLLLDELDELKEYKITHHFLENVTAENKTTCIKKIYQYFSKNMRGYYLTQVLATVIGLVAFYILAVTPNQCQTWSTIQYFDFIGLVYIWQYYQLKISSNVYRTLTISNYESLLKCFEQQEQITASNQKATT